MVDIPINIKNDWILWLANNIQWLIESLLSVRELGTRLVLPEDSVDTAKKDGT